MRILGDVYSYNEDLSPEVATAGEFMQMIQMCGPLSNVEGDPHFRLLYSNKMFQNGLDQICFLLMTVVAIEQQVKRNSIKNTSLWFHHQKVVFHLPILWSGVYH